MINTRAPDGANKIEAKHVYLVLPFWGTITFNTAITRINVYANIKSIMRP